MAIILRSIKELEAPNEVEKHLNDTREVQPLIPPPSLGEVEKEQVVDTPP